MSFFTLIEILRIRSLYKCIIEGIIILFLLNCCPNLQCLGFYNFCFAKDFNEWQQIAKFLSNKIIKFSTNNGLFVPRNNGNIDFYPIEEFVNHLISLKDLVIAREADSEEKLFKNMSKNIRILYLKPGTIHINQINELIENQSKEITSLLLNEIYIYEEILDTIFENFNLEQFSFSCETLSLKKNFELTKFEGNLKF